MPRGHLKSLRSLAIEPRIWSMQTWCEAYFRPSPTLLHDCSLSQRAAESCSTMEASVDEACVLVERDSVLVPGAAASCDVSCSQATRQPVVNRKIALMSRFRSMARCQSTGRACETSDPNASVSRPGACLGKGFRRIADSAGGVS